MDIFIAIIMMMGCAIACLWLRVKSLEEVIDKDHRYYEWWLRSMEERKADKPETEWSEVEED